MSYYLSCKLFYGFELERDGDAEVDEDLADQAKDDYGEYTDLQTPIMVSNVGYYEMRPVVGIRSTFFQSSGGSLTAVTLPTVDPAWDKQLEDWCKQFGYTYKTPSWQLAALLW